MSVLQIFSNNYKNILKEISTSGPNETDYTTLFNFFSEVDLARQNQQLTNEEILVMRSWFLGSMDDERTLQGHVCKKPRGYDGDFEIIDKIYNYHTSTNPTNQKWDIFFHQGDATKAVRNRKDFFKAVLAQLPEGSNILNLASGSCRDIFEYANESSKKLQFDNVELDKGAIEFGGNLLNNTKHIEVNFINENIVKYTPIKKYDLIWSAGLFDYLNDKYFTALVQRFSNYVLPNGKMIIGNFNTTNTSKPYMEFGDWFLFHRTEQDLLQLTEGINCVSKVVEAEKLNVNLFLKLEF